MRLTFRKGDFVAAALVLTLAVGLSLALWVRAQAAQNTYAAIYHNGELIREVSLNTDQTLSVSGDYINTVTVHGGQIAITHSTCPGSDCVHSGWVSTAGRAIVCLPNRTEIRLVGTQNTDGVDAIAG